MSLVSRSPEFRLVVWLFVMVAAAFLAVQEGAITGYDGQTTFEVTRSLVERRTFAVSEEFNTQPGIDGRAYGRYGLGLSLVAAIPYLAVRPLALASSDQDHVLEAAAASVMPLVAAALVVALYLLARRLGAGPRSALVVAVGAVAGTFVLPYSKEFFAEPLTALGLVVSIERLLARRPTAAGWWLGAAVLVRPQTLLFTPVVLLVAWSQEGFRSAFRIAAGAAPGVLATFTYNIIRFGHPLRFGYEDVGFTTPLLTGVSGLLFEPTKSVLLFAPIVLLLPFALWRLGRFNRSAFVLVASNLGITFVAVAMWFAWHGGWCWGPRLILPGVVPAIAAIAPWADTLGRRRLAELLFVLGCAVSLPALIVPTQAQQLEIPPVPRSAHFLPTQPLASPFPLRQFQLIGPIGRYSFEHAFDHVDDGRNYLRYLSLWQFGLTRQFQETGLLMSVAGTGLLFAVILISGRRVNAALREVGRSGTGQGRPHDELNQVAFQFPNAPIHARDHQAE